MMDSNRNVNNFLRSAIVEKGVYILDIRDSVIERTVKSAISKFAGTVIDKIDKRMLPVALISDGKYVKFLQNCHHEEQMQYFKSLPVICKEAITNNIPMIHAHTFLNRCEALRKLNNTPCSQQPQFRKSVTPTRKLSQPSPVVGLTTVNRIELNDVIIRDKDPKYGVLIKNVKPVKMHLGQSFGNCLFALSGADLEKKRKHDIEMEKNGELQYNSKASVPFKEHPLPKKAKINHGFCEICACSDADIEKHYRTNEHQLKTKVPGFYDDLDMVIATHGSNQAFNPQYVLDDISLDSDENIKDCLTKFPNDYVFAGDYLFVKELEELNDMIKYHISESNVQLGTENEKS